MNIIYLDTLFLVNFICDYILLLCTARVSGAEIRRPFIAGASAIGGLYACLCTVPHCIWMQQPLVQSACSVLICMTAFGQERTLLRCTVIFLCTSAMVGGFLSAASVNLNQVLYLPVDLKMTILMFAAVYGMLSLFFRRFPHLRQNEYHRISITMNDHTIKFKALRDTGNELFDPITNLPVLICDAKLLQTLFPEVTLTLVDPYQTFFELNKISGCENKMKLIPYQTISDSGVLLGFKPDSVLLDDREEHYIIAFSPKEFRTTAEYKAIF